MITPIQTEVELKQLRRDVDALQKELALVRQMVADSHCPEAIAQDHALVKMIESVKAVEGQCG